MNASLLVEPSALHRLLRGAEEERTVDLVESRRPSGSRPGARSRPASRRGCRRASVSSAMRRMKSSAASTTPTETATTMSKRTVSTKQVSSTRTSLFGATLHDADEVAHLGHVPRDEQEQRGERGHRHVRDAAARAAASTSSTTSAWVTAANGERAPARMFVAVRASAPVAAMPPKNGATMLPMPSATSSAFGSCLVSGHAVGDDRGEQRLDRAEHRDGERRQERARGPALKRERPPCPTGSAGDGQDAAECPATSTPSDRGVKAAADRRDVEAGVEVVQDARQRPATTPIARAAPGPS